MESPKARMIAVMRSMPGDPRQQRSTGCRRTAPRAPSRALVAAVARWLGGRVGGSGAPAAGVDAAGDLLAAAVGLAGEHERVEVEPVGVDAQGLARVVA